jgi:phage tail P2-like protein
MIRLEDASLVDFLPESIASDPDIIALSLAIDPELRAVGAAIIEAIIWPRIAELDDQLLNEIAWACRFNELQLWDTATTDGKRALLVNLFAIRKKSGTRFSVRRIFDLVSVVGLLTEWWEEGAPAFTYRLRIFITDTGVTQQQLDQIPELLERFSPVRSYLSELAVESDRLGSLLPYPALTVGRLTTIPFGGP